MVFIICILFIHTIHNVNHSVLPFTKEQLTFDDVIAEFMKTLEKMGIVIFNLI